MNENLILNYHTISAEELRQIIENAEAELAKRANDEFEKARENVVTAIDEFIECCKKANIRTLGNIYWECSDCDEGQYFDILREEVLNDVMKILKDYKLKKQVAEV